MSVASRLLTIMWAEGEVARAANGGAWFTNRAVWTTAERRRGGQRALPDARRAWAQLVRRWLERFGPGTETDLRWWLGATTTIVRTALADVRAVEVDLDGGVVGWVVPGDEHDVEPPGRWAALLPTLDPTTMGHKQRAFYTSGHDAALFDTAGNGGTTAWVDGRMVGAWASTDAGSVRLHLVEDVDGEARALLEERAARLEAFVEGRRVTALYSSPLVARIRRDEQR